MLIKSTKDYGQFKFIVGNRDIDMNHVNKLVKLNSEVNLLWQFPGLVTKDGYLWDGQHRLKAAEANDWDFYYTVSDKTLAELGDSIVPLTNTAQLPWKPMQYINWYAKHGNEQFIFLQELMEEYKLTYYQIINLLRGSSTASEIRRGTLKLFNTPEDKKNIASLLEEYLLLKTGVDRKMHLDTYFIRAIRTMFKYVSAQEILEALDRAPMQLIPVRGAAEYLRQFEEAFNYRRAEKNYKRFF